MNEIKEILWEITLQCNKGCKYCGSKLFLNKEIEDKINRVKIAKEIISVKPKEVTITGGEPTVVLHDLIQASEMLSKNNIDVKILTNGSLFKSEHFKFLDKYVNVYGISVNEKEDIESLDGIHGMIPFNKTVMITNFGTHNIDLFGELWKKAQNFATWQVQLTMGNQFQLDIPEIEDLLNKIKECNEFNKTQKLSVPIIKADNLVCGKCPAGCKGFSITYNGDVVPCLSYRSWKNDMDVQGNVFVEPLKKIWNDKFEFYRGRVFVPCCKSITGIEKVKSSESEDLTKCFPLPSRESVFPEKQKRKKAPNKEENTVFVYGVATPPNDWNTVVVYGVNIYGNKE